MIVKQKAKLRNLKKFDNLKNKTEADKIGKINLLAATPRPSEIGSLKIQSLVILLCHPHLLWAHWGI